MFFSNLVISSRNICVLRLRKDVTGLAVWLSFVCCATNVWGGNQARNWLGTPGGEEFSEGGPNFLTMSNSLKQCSTLFSRRRSKSPLVTGVEGTEKSPRTHCLGRSVAIQIHKKDENRTKVCWKQISFACEATSWTYFRLWLSAFGTCLISVYKRIYQLCFAQLLVACCRNVLTLWNFVDTLFYLKNL